MNVNKNSPLKVAISASTSVALFFCRFAPGFDLDVAESLVGAVSVSCLRIWPPELTEITLDPQKLLRWELFRSPHIYIPNDLET